MSDDRKKLDGDGIRRALKGARSVTKRTLKGGGEVPTGGGWDGSVDTETGLPLDCPVRALGHHGKTCYYLDAAAQVIDLEASEHGRMYVMKIFGDHNARLYDYWPRTNDKGEVTGWRPERASEDLVRACSRRGIWTPKDRVRGRGAWRGLSGELIYHCGDRVVFSEADGVREVPPGVVGRDVYPADEPVARPDTACTPEQSKAAAERLRMLLMSWPWRSGEIDARLMLGWIGAAMIGGALDWRPAVWVTGSRGSGKSTLHEVLRGVFDGALISVSDTTAAGLWQNVGHKTEPIAVDEIEATEDPRRANAVIAYARQASSAGKVLRGGSDHAGAEFIARSCFLFSSITMPSMPAQDRSRLAVLDLNELASNARPLALDRKDLVAIGAMLRARLMRQWPRWNDTWQQYRAGLARVGHDARGADQFGTLLAAADILLHDAVPDTDSVDQWTSQLPRILTSADEEVDERRCLLHLTSQAVDPYRSGNRSLLGKWIEWASRDDSVFVDGGLTPAPDAANKVLVTYGLKVVTNAGTKWLAIANQHAMLQQFFQHTHWAARSGASGVWTQMLARLPNAHRSGKAIWFNGAVAKAVLVPIDVVLPPDQERDDQ